MKYFLHPNGICESENIGIGTKIWAFAHILPGTRIGKDCNICDHVFIENDVIIGDRVTIKCGVQLWDGLRVANDVFIGPNATFTNDKEPRSKQYQATIPQTFIERGASIGANSTILPGLTIGRDAMIGAGSVVTESVPPRAIVMGNPGRICGYVSTPISQTQQVLNIPDSPRPKTINSEVKGVVLYNLKAVADLRGNLSVGHFESEVPFVPKRYFLVFDVPNKHVRGEHAHKKCAQFLVCAKGSLHVLVDNGSVREEFVLDRPSIGIYLPTMVWSVQYKFSQEAVLLVFASDDYDPDDYIRDYGEFMELIR